ncbi:MAG: hypothetical protein WA240_02995 [Nitrospirota bacterium]
MPDLNIQERNNKCVAVRKASIVYGNEFLIDTFPSDQPYPGAWELIRRPQRDTAAIRPKYSFCNTSAVNPESYKVLESEWSVIKDPFTQVGLLDSEEEQLQELILRIKTSQSIQYRESLANRLVTLLHDAKEEDPNSLGIAVGSLRNCINFLQLHTNLKCPIISLTPEYNIYSTWRVEKNRLFSVHFLPNGDARFVIFKPNNRHPERTIRISGAVTADMLMETVATYGVWDWILE